MPKAPQVVRSRGTQSIAWWGVLLALPLAACEAPSPPDTSLRPVVVEPVVAVDQVGAKLYPGTVTARDGSILSFRVAGEVTKMPVDAGDRVETGDLLAELDPQDARLTLRAAEAAVTAAEADARLAEAEMRRYRDLLDRGFISASGFELRENQHALAMARVDQAKAEAAVNRNQSSYTRLVAPQKGLVTSTSIEAGEVVSPGQPVLRFVPDEGREVEIQIPEGRLAQFAVGTEASVGLWAHPDKRYRGTVREITPQADPATRTHRVRLQFVDADDRVQLGMTANVVMDRASDETQFLVRHSAIGEHDGKAVVWRVVDDKVEPQVVEVVRYQESGAVLRGALKAGELVVSAGVHRLIPGQTVTVSERPYAERDAAEVEAEAAP
jgi:membrane fusion protein, multidrug efflux system